MQSRTKEILASITPGEALALLQEGNRRFVNGRSQERKLLEQVDETSRAQFPFAVVLGCIDSRVPPELIFDQGIGDIFSIRIAGNFVNEDILGSMEFACKVVGAKHILVLGHTSCGAIKGAYDNVELGHLTGLLGKLKPAVEAVRESSDLEGDVNVDQITEINVHMTIANIKRQSAILKALLDNREIGISGAIYNTASGEVSFL